MSAANFKTIGELAIILRKDRRTVAARLEAAGVEPVAARGKNNSRLYDLDQAQAAMRVEEMSELNKLKARKLRLDIEKQEFEKKIKADEYTASEAVRHVWADEIKTLYQVTTTRLPRVIVEKAMQFAKGDRADTTDFQAAVRIALAEFWSDFREGKIVRESSLTPIKPGIPEGEK